MKRIFALLLALCMVLALAACGGKPAPEEPAAPAAAEPEATPEPEELPPANALDETSPIPADNYHGELTEQVFESENLRLQLPEGVTAVNEGATDNFGHITVTDDAGEWKLMFRPFKLGYDTTANNVDSTVIYDDNPIKIDWSRDVGTTLAGFPTRVWANNIRPGWLHPSNEQDAPAVDILVDYGETLVGPWYGLYIRLEAQDPQEDTNIYELLYRRALRAVLNNFEVLTTSDGILYSAGGISATFPARWDVKVGENGLVTYFHSQELTGGLNFGTTNGGDPAELVSHWEGEAISKTYGGTEFTGVIMENVPDDPESPSTYTMRLYGPFNDSRSLTVHFNLRGFQPADYKAFLDNEMIVGVMESLSIDPDGYHEPGTASADGFTTDRGRIDSYDGSDAELEIPAVIGEYDTVEIGADVFRGNTSITSVVIPEGVTTIQPSAFEGCTNLTTVVFPDTLMEIGSNAFRDCPNLTDVVLPDAVVWVGDRVFDSSGQGTFTGAAAEYGLGCFDSSAFEVISFPAGADVSAEGMFSASEARQIDLPSDLTALGRSAFSNCKKLEKLDLPDTLRELGEGCFINMFGGYSLTLPDGITEIPDECFNSTNLDVLVIPESVTRIGDYATYSGAYIVLMNPEVELGHSSLNCEYLYIQDAKNFVFPDDSAIWASRVYLDGVYDPAEIQGNFAAQTVKDQLYLPMDATFEESDALDQWLMSIGCSDIAWIGSARDFLPESTLDFQLSGSTITGYTGDGPMLNIPQYVMRYDDPFWSSIHTYSIADEAFAGSSVTSIYFPGTMWDGFGSRLLAGDEALTDIWFNMCSLNDAGRDGVFSPDTFDGIPDGVTVHLPACLGDDERAAAEELLRSFGLPDATVFDYYSLR